MATSQSPHGLEYINIVNLLEFNKESFPRPDASWGLTVPLFNCTTNTGRSCFLYGQPVPELDNGSGS